MRRSICAAFYRNQAVRMLVHNSLPFSPSLRSLALSPISHIAPHIPPSPSLPVPYPPQPSDTAIVLPSVPGSSSPVFRLYTTLVILYSLFPSPATPYLPPSPSPFPNPPFVPQSVAVHYMNSSVTESPFAQLLRRLNLKIHAFLQGKTTLL